MMRSLRTSPTSRIRIAKPVRTWNCALIRERQHTSDSICTRQPHHHSLCIYTNIRVRSIANSRHHRLETHPSGTFIVESFLKKRGAYHHDANADPRNHEGVCIGHKRPDVCTRLFWSSICTSFVAKGSSS